jgi:beta-fructofuranosidase
MNLTDAAKERVAPAVAAATKNRSEKSLLVLITLVILVGGQAAVAQKNNEEMMRDTRALREKLLRDPYRPAYHFVTLEGRCSPFDINAAIFWKGRYHIFYIFQNEKGHCWGHASSIDLVHWRHHPTALEPGEGDRGIFSGGAFIDKNGVPTITYWGLDRGVCIATSTDDELNEWTKSPHNPAIRETHHGYAVIDSNSSETDKLVYGVADPTAIWIHEGRYYMLTGNLLVLREFGRKQNQPEHLGDQAYLFVSDDLVEWKYLHPFYKSDRKWTRDDEDNVRTEGLLAIVTCCYLSATTSAASTTWAGTPTTASTQRRTGG